MKNNEGNPFHMKGIYTKYFTIILLILCMLIFSSCRNAEQINSDVSQSIYSEEDETRKQNNQIQKDEVDEQLVNASEQQDNKEVPDENLILDKKETSSQILDSLIKEHSVSQGDYIYFGAYLKEPILWRIVRIDDDMNMMLYSENILTFKPYDAAESGQMGFLNSGEGYLEAVGEYEFREFYGSGTWYDSNLRDWLNSEDNFVEYTTFPPTEEATSGDGVEYDSEPGFLTNFSDEEIRFINTIKVKTAVTLLGLTELDGGNELYEITYNNEREIDSISTNFESAYYKETADRVFILSVEELIELNIDFDLRRYPTTASANQNKVAKIYEEDLYNYWTRTSCEVRLNEVYIYKAKRKKFGSIEAPCASFDFGVVPSLWLNNEISEFFIGEGTIKNPYQVVFNN